MINRALYDVVFSDTWDRQMRFITGPRQSGKTTIAKHKLSREKTENLYYLWDLRTVRNRYKDNELFFTQDFPPKKKKQWICFDEIHKMPKWKNMLKGIYDEVEEYYHFIITGSAKFSIARKSGDSLSGRYFVFTLFPLRLDEVLNTYSESLNPPAEIHDYILSKLNSKSESQEAMESLLHFGGFPEPFVKQKESFLKRWTNDYVDTIIKEDISLLTRITDSDYLFDLYNLLPSMIGYPLSESSLASHVNVSPVTLKRYLKRLEEFYLFFQIRPYSKNIKRSLLKASKGYLYNWSIITDEGARFENYIACELKSKLSQWYELSGVNYDLFFIRNKLKQETDFLILRDNKPWLLIETKLKDKPIDKHQFTIAEKLSVPLIQLCKEDNIASMQKKGIFRLSASAFLS